MRDYTTERDAILRRWYGRDQFPTRRQARTWDNPITPQDYVGVQTPPNLPFTFEAPGDCLVWLHGLNTDGYGRLTIAGKTDFAHRVAYRHAVDEIPDGMQLNHLCNRPYCIQPAHLYAGTQQDNKDDSHLFGTDRMLSPAFLVSAYLDAEFDDPLLQRIQASNRRQFVEPWPSPTTPTQTAMEEFECPRHDFSIPAGDGAVCRTCERFENAGVVSQGYHIALIGKEICPVSQLINSVLRKVVSLDLANDEWKGWREKCMHRAGILGKDHHIRNCPCMFCESDRKTFREHLEPSLTSTESYVLDICDLIEPLISERIRDMRRQTFEDDFPLVAGDFTDRQKADLLGHFDDCINTIQEERNAAQQVERLLGYYLHAVVTYESLDAFAENDSYFKYWRPFGYPLPENQREALELCMMNAVRTGDVIFDHLNDLTDEFVREHKSLGADDRGQVLGFTHFLVAGDLFDVLTYDLFGVSSHSKVDPLPHQGCVEEVLDFS